MNVAGLQKNIKSGDLIIVHVNSKSLVSDGIEWFTDGTVSHVAIAINDTWIVEALAIKGVKVEPLSKYFDDKYSIIVRRLPIDFQNLNNKVVDFVESKVGNRYDFSQVFIDGVGLIAGKLGLNRFKAWFGRQVLGWKDGWTCSELFSVAVWEKVGLNLSPLKDVRTHTPQDLLESPLLVTVFRA